MEGRAHSSLPFPRPRYLFWLRDADPSGGRGNSWNRGGEEAIGHHGVSEEMVQNKPNESPAFGAGGAWWVSGRSETVEGGVQSGIHPDR